MRAELGEAAPELTLDVGHLYAVWEGEPDKVIERAAPLRFRYELRPCTNLQSSVWRLTR